MGFERSYQIRILSNQLNKLFFSTLNLHGDLVKESPQLNPYFVTGFCDAESSFQVLLVKTKNSKLG